VCIPIIGGDNAWCVFSVSWTIINLLHLNYKKLLNYTTLIKCITSKHGKLMMTLIDGFKLNFEYKSVQAYITK